MEETAAKRPKLEMKHVCLESILPEELVNDIPLLKVFVATITDPKKISKVIITLNDKLPVVELQHLKRIKGREVILCPVSWLELDNSKISEFFLEKCATVEGIDFQTCTIREVAAIPPKTKQQYQVVNQHWPCNFHSNKYLEQLVTNTLFSKQELELHTKMLQLANEIRNIQVASMKARKHSEDNCKGDCGVVVVDPLRKNLIIAAGYSLIDIDPTLHSTMVAIDAVAVSQNGGAFSQLKLQIDWADLLKGQFSDLKVLKRKTKLNIYIESTNTTNSNEVIMNDISEEEYLCTNYHVYMTHEPCTMCAMALIHSRAKRVFYIHPTSNGALGTTCKIHTVKALNHHYEVFKVADNCMTYFNS